jgi:hypothetical protein
MRRSLLLAAAFAALVAGCVNQQDVDAWRGRSVAELDVHPVFATMQLSSRMAADGTEVRNYINAKEMVSCAGQAGSTAYGRQVNNRVR